MPDHIHVLLTPQTSLERAVQFIKGGFSYRARKELGSNIEVWQKGFSDHRVCDAEDDLLHVDYIRQNPIHKDLCDRAEEYPYSSAGAGIEPDQGLRPILVDHAYGVPEGAPLSKQTSECGRQSARTSQIQEDRIL
jgi:putative transposase